VEHFDLSARGRVAIVSYKEANTNVEARLRIEVAAGKVSAAKDEIAGVPQAIAAAELFGTTAGAAPTNVKEVAHLVCTPCNDGDLPSDMYYAPACDGLCAPCTVCGADAYASELCSGRKDTTCTDLPDFDSQVDFTFGSPDNTAWPSFAATGRVDADTVTRELTVLHAGEDGMGSITASVGGVTAEAPFTPRLDPGVTVALAVVSEVVHFDAPMFKAVAQVYDAFGNTFVDAAAAVVTATIRVTRPGDAVLTTVGEATCTPAERSGLCTLLFDMTGIITAFGQSDERRIAVSYKVNVAAPVDLPDAQRPRLISLAKSRPSFATGFAVLMPWQAPAVGERLPFRVLARAPRSLSTFRVVLEVTGDASLVADSVTAADGWSLSVEQDVDSGAVTVVGFNAASADVALTTSQSVFSFELAVAPTATGNVEVQLQPSELRMVRQLAAVPLGSSAAYFQANGDSLGNRGMLTVVSHGVRDAFLALPSGRRDIFNAARVTGTNTVVTLGLYTVYTTGESLRTGAPAGSVSCSKQAGGNADAITVAQDCSTVTLEASGSAGEVNVAASVAGGAHDVARSLAVRVWAPEGNVQLTAHVPTLRPIRGVYNSDTACAPRMMWDTPRALVVYSNGGGNRPLTDITSLVKHRYTVASGSAVAVSAVGVVVGVKAGTATVALDDTTTLAADPLTYTVAVDREAVVVGLDAFAVTGVTVSTPIVNGPATADTVTASATTGTAATVEGQAVAVPVTAVILDPTGETAIYRLPLTSAQGLSLSLTAAANVLVMAEGDVEGLFEALGDGQATVTASWPSAACPDAFTLSTAVDVDIDLERAASLCVELADGGAAEGLKLGVVSGSVHTVLPGVFPDRATLKLTLVYADGREEDATSQAVLTDTPDGSLSFTSSGIIRGFVAGAATATFTVPTHPDVDATINVVVVAVDKLEARDAQDTALPTTVSVAYINTVGYMPLLLQVVAVLEPASEGVLRVDPANLDILEDEDYTAELAADKFVVLKFADDESSSSAPLVVLHTGLFVQMDLSKSNPRTLTAISNVALISLESKSAVASGAVLTATAGVAAYAIVADLTFTGDIVIPGAALRDVTTGALTLPSSLIRFLSLDTASATTDVNTGIVTLAGNVPGTAGVRFRVDSKANTSIFAVSGTALIANPSAPDNSFDVGSTTGGGPAFATQPAVGDAFEVPLQLRLSAPAGAVQILVSFSDPSAVELRQVRAGADASAPLLRYVRRADGSLAITAVHLIAQQPGADGAALEWAVLALTAAKAGPCVVSLQVVTIRPPGGGPALADDVAAPAARISFQFAEGDRRRRAVAVPQPLAGHGNPAAVISHRARRTTVAELDLDEDGTLTTNDALLLLDLINSNDLDNAVDADENGDVELQDVVFFLDVLVGRVQLLDDVTLTAVQEDASDCRFKASALLIRPSNVPTNTPLLYFDFAGIETAADFVSTFPPGSFTMETKPAGHTGGLVRAQEAVVDATTSRFSLDVEMAIAQADDVGLSVWQIANALPDAHYFHTGGIGASAAYPDPMQTGDLFEINNVDLTFYYPNGYSPLLLFKNTLSTEDCLLQRAPQNLGATGTPGDGTEMTIAWNAPSTSPATRLPTEYAVQYRISASQPRDELASALDPDEDVFSTANEVVVAAGLTTAVITGLRLYALYDCQVQVIVGPVRSVISPVLMEQRTAADVPASAPQDLAVAAKDSSSLTVAWTKVPKADENGPLEYVVVYEREADQATADQSIPSGPFELRAGDVSEFFIEDLERNISYRIYVFARTVQLVGNVYNNGPASVDVVGTTDPSAPCTPGTRITNPNAVDVDSKCEACPTGTSTDSINQETCTASSSTPTHVAAITGSVMGVALALVLLLAVIRCRRYQKRRQRSQLAPSFNAPSPSENAVQRNNTDPASGNHWIMSLGEPSPDSIALGDLYDKVEHAETPTAVYELPIFPAAPDEEHGSSTVSIQPGYTLLSDDHRRDLDACTADERLRSEDTLSWGSAGTATPGYATLDGTQQLYADGGGLARNSDNDGNATESLPGLYATILAESSGYAALTGQADERITVSRTPRRISGITADEEA
jgi:hypothetical protein